MRAFLKVSIAMAIVGHVSIFAEGQPNFIIIYADDMGYGDLGCYGAEGYETPELDRMAKQGIRFTDFSTSSSVCTPSRAGLLTGRFAQRWGHDNKVYFPHSKGGMPPSEITIAELLKEKGYQTALIGKWHLGHRAKFLPTAQGFDLYYGIPYSNDMWQAPETPLADNIVFNEGMTRENYLEGGKKKYHNQVPLMAGTEVIEWPVDQATLTKRYTEKAQAFITVNKEQPFFLYLAHAMPHVPLYATEEFKGKTERGLYGDVIEELDWSVGQILNTLKKNGLDKNTLVIFTSDNGPYLGAKSTAAVPARSVMENSRPMKEDAACRVSHGSRARCRPVWSAMCRPRRWICFRPLPRWLMLQFRLIGRLTGWISARSSKGTLRIFRNGTGTFIEVRRFGSATGNMCTTKRETSCLTLPKMWAKRKTWRNSIRKKRKPSRSGLPRSRASCQEQSSSPASEAQIERAT